MSPPPGPGIGLVVCPGSGSCKEKIPRVSGFRAGGGRLDLPDPLAYHWFVHELGLATEIVRLLEDQRRQRGFTRVNIVRLRAGALSGVDGHALQLAFQIAREGSCAAGAALQLEQREMTLLCRQCGQTAGPADRGGGPDTCPACQSGELVIQGEEGIDVVSIEVD